MLGYPFGGQGLILKYMEEKEHKNLLQHFSLPVHPYLMAQEVLNICTTDNSLTKEQVLVFIPSFWCYPILNTVHFDSGI